MSAANHLIAGLPRRARNDLFRNGAIAELEFGTVLCEPGAPLEHVYFPLTAFIATIPGPDEHSLDVRFIGDEGMLGASLAVDIDVVPLRAVVQGSGTMLRIGTPAFARVLRRSGTLRRTLRRYLGVLAEQQSQGSDCNRVHDLEARLARCLLMTHDRAHADRVRLTHDFLAELLNARRGDIGIATATLRQRQVISCERGTIRVLDRPGLEAASCECYGLARAQYTRALGSPARHRVTPSGSAQNDQPQHAGA